MEGKTKDITISMSQIFEALDVTKRKSKVICTLGPACWDTEMLV